MIEMVPEFGKPGHRFDTGPFLLDLYHLFGIVLGDRQLADMEQRTEQHSAVARRVSLQRTYSYHDFHCGRSPHLI
jgi:hypothetical protein